MIADLEQLGSPAPDTHGAYGSGAAGTLVHPLQRVNSPVPERQLGCAPRTEKGEAFAPPSLTKGHFSGVVTVPR